MGIPRINHWNNSPLSYAPSDTQEPDASFAVSMAIDNNIDSLHSTRGNVKSKTRLTNTEQRPLLASNYSKCGSRLSMGLTSSIVAPKKCIAYSIASSFVSKGESFAILGR